MKVWGINSDNIQRDRVHEQTLLDIIDGEALTPWSDRYQFIVDRTDEYTFICAMEKPPDAQHLDTLSFAVAEDRRGHRYILGLPCSWNCGSGTNLLQRIAIGSDQEIVRRGFASGRIQQSGEQAAIKCKAEQWEYPKYTSVIERAFCEAWQRRTPGLWDGVTLPGRQ